LRTHQKFNSLFVDRIRRGDGAGLFQCDQCLAGGVSVTLELRKLAPPAVGSLLG
jgi:hypothetical protein